MDEAHCPHVSGWAGGYALGMFRVPPHLNVAGRQPNDQKSLHFPLRSLW